MMVVDASAILAILFNEPEADDFRDVLLRAGGGRMSPVNHWEVLVRAEAKQGRVVRLEAEALMADLGIEVTLASAVTSRAAADAFQRYGKNTPGRLNLGDCFAYALAAAEGDGLLFKGDDFPRTDLKPAV